MHTKTNKHTKTNIHTHTHKHTHTHAQTHTHTHAQTHTRSLYPTGQTEGSTHAAIGWPLRPPRTLASSPLTLMSKNPPPVRLPSKNPPPPARLPSIKLRRLESIHPVLLMSMPPMPAGGGSTADPGKELPLPPPPCCPPGCCLPPPPRLVTVECPLLPTSEEEFVFDDLDPRENKLFKRLFFSPPPPPPLLGAPPPAAADAAALPPLPMAFAAAFAASFSSRCRSFRSCTRSVRRPCALFACFDFNFDVEMVGMRLDGLVVVAGGGGLLSRNATTAGRVPKPNPSIHTMSLHVQPQGRQTCRSLA